MANLCLVRDIMNGIDFMAEISKMLEKDKEKRAIIYKGLTEEQIKDKKTRYRAIRRYINFLSEYEREQKEKERKKEERELNKWKKKVGLK